MQLASLRAAAGAALLILAPAAQAAGPTPAATGLVAEAWALFERYDEDLGRIDQARDVLERAITRERTVAALILLTWVHLNWAELRATTPEEKLAGYQRGRDVAKLAVELAPRSAEAHLWYAANLGRWATTKGKLRAAFLLATIKEEIETALALAPNHPAALALAGSFYFETPGLLGGDVARAETYHRKALAADAHFTRARVELARCLLEQRRYNEARRELQRVLDEKQPSYHADWAVKHRPTAQRLLAQLRGKP